MAQWPKGTSSTASNSQLDFGRLFSYSALQMRSPNGSKPQQSDTVTSAGFHCRSQKPWQSPATLKNGAQEVQRTGQGLYSNCTEAPVEQKESHVVLLRLQVGQQLCGHWLVKNQKNNQLGFLWAKCRTQHLAVSEVCSSCPSPSNTVADNNSLQKLKLLLNPWKRMEFLEHW